MKWVVFSQCFQDFLFLLAFINLNIMCLVAFFVHVVFSWRSLNFLGLEIKVSHQNGKFSAIIFWIIFCPFLCPPQFLLLNILFSFIKKNTMIPVLEKYMIISRWRIGFKLRVPGVDGHEHRWGPHCMSHCSSLPHSQDIETGKGRHPTVFVLIPYVVLPQITIG